MQARPLLLAGLGEHERAGRKGEGGQVVFSAGPDTRFFPVEPAGDHQVKNQESFAGKMPDDALADAGQVEDGFASEREEIGLDGADEEWAFDLDLFERLADDLRLQGDEVAGDVGELGHKVRKTKD